MKHISMSSLVFVLLVGLAGPVFAQYYYSDSTAIPLYVDSNLITIKFDEETSGQSQQAILSAIGRVTGTVPDDHVIEGFIACSVSTPSNYGGFLDSVEAIDGIYKVEPFYRNDLDSAFPVNSLFCVAFVESLSRSAIDSINADYGVVVVREIPEMDNVFVLKNTDSSGYRLLDIANLYYNMAETRYSHPDFGVWVHQQEYKLYDYYHAYQPHIKKVIGSFNSASVWDFGIPSQHAIVAVIDDGFETHEELTHFRLATGFDLADLDEDIHPGEYQAHGMGCAGIIAASHCTDSVNGLSASSGVISLNPNATIYGFKIFHDNGSSAGVTPTRIAQAITWAYTAGADVISNSWCYFQNCTYQFDVINDALHNAAVRGRGGLGCPVIFAAGNYEESFSGVAYPSCLNTVLAIGAVRLDDSLWYYSSRGSHLDLVAPSGDVCLQGNVWTLDQMGNSGYNPNVSSACGFSTIWNCPMVIDNDMNYDCRFGGTSAACPVVSGTVSLLLCRKYDLSAQEIYNILRYSAVTDLDWGSVAPPSNNYGYGRVDAFRAMLSIARGDLDHDGTVTPGDLSALIDILFISLEPAFPHPLLADCNCDGVVGLGDLTAMVDNLYISLQPLPTPCFEFGD